MSPFRKLPARLQVPQESGVTVPRIAITEDLSEVLTVLSRYRRQLR